jgi:hypothetical protein
VSFGNFRVWDRSDIRYCGFACAPLVRSYLVPRRKVMLVRNTLAFMPGHPKNSMICIAHNLAKLAAAR